MAVAAPVGGGSRRIPEDCAPGCGAGTVTELFGIVVIDADITDVRKGEGDDLAHIGRICQDLLISGHRSVEADLPDGRPYGADPLTLKHRAIRQNEDTRASGQQGIAHRRAPSRGQGWSGPSVGARERQGRHIRLRPLLMAQAVAPVGPEVKKLRSISCSGPP